MVERIPNFNNNNSSNSQNYQNNRNNNNNNNSRSIHSTPTTLASRIQREDHLPNDVELGDSRRAIVPPIVKAKRPITLTSTNSNSNSNSNINRNSNYSNPNSNRGQSNRGSRGGRGISNNNFRGRGNSNGLSRKQHERVWGAASDVLIPKGPSGTRIQAPKSGSMPSYLWIGAIPLGTSEKEIRDLCVPFGLDKLTFANHNPESPVTHAYAQFTTDDGGRKALSLHHTNLSSGARISVRPHDPNYSTLLRESGVSRDLTGGGIEMEHYDNSDSVRFDTFSSGTMGSSSSLGMGVASGSGSNNNNRSTSGSNNTSTAVSSHSSREESLDSRPQIPSTLFNRQSPTLSPGPKFESSQQTSPQSQSQSIFFPFAPTRPPTLSSRISSPNIFVPRESEPESFSRPNPFNSTSSSYSPAITSSIPYSPRTVVETPLVPLVAINAEPEILSKFVDKGKGKEIISEEEEEEIDQLISEDDVDQVVSEEVGEGEGEADGDGDDMSISSIGDSDDGLIIETLVSPRKESIAEVDSAAEQGMVLVEALKIESRGKEIEEEIVEEGEEEQEETALVERINLPDDCKGKSVLTGRKRQSLLITELQKAVTLGRVVLSQTFEEDALVLEYIQDSVPLPEALPAVAVPEALPLPASLPLPLPLPLPVATSSNNPSPIPTPPIQPLFKPIPSNNSGSNEDTSEDIKPIIVDKEIIVAPPVPEVELPPVYYPFGMRKSTWDSLETKKHVEAFISSFFPVFDSTRSSVTNYYVPKATFSIRAITTAPPHLKDVNDFSSRYTKCTTIVHTHNEISHATSRLPPGSHDLSKLIYDAYKVHTTVPTSSKTTLRPTIHLTIHGIFDEFAGHVQRSFNRSYILVPKSISVGLGSPLAYLIQSDQLIFRHYDELAPLPLLVIGQKVVPPVIQPTPTLPKASLPKPLAPVQPQIRENPNPIRRAPLPAPVSANRSPNLPMRIPPFITASASASTSTLEKRSRPETDESDDSDIEIIEPSTPFISNTASTSASTSSSSVVRPQAKKNDSRLSPDPLVNQLGAGPSKKSLGKRKADNTPLQTDSPPLAKKKNINSNNSNNNEKQQQQSGSTSGSTSESTNLAELTGTALAQIQRMVAAEVAKATGNASTPQSQAPKARRPRSPDSEEGVEIIPAKKNKKGKEKEVVVQEKGKQKEKSQVRNENPNIFMNGVSNSVTHGFNGKSNKLRYFVDTGSEFLATTIRGDVVSWDGATTNQSIKRVYSSTQEAFKVDDIAYSLAHKTLIVGYLGPVKGKGDLSLKPDHQIRLFEGAEDHYGRVQYTPRPLTEAPHSSGVTSVCIIPDNKRLRFVTAGEDKSIYIWSRTKLGVISSTVLSTDHSTKPSSLACIQSKKYLISAGEDKKIIAYDLENRVTVWKVRSHSGFTSVEAVPRSESLILARDRAPSSQFKIYDLRVISSNGPILEFGAAILSPPTSAVDNKDDKTISRYLRGSFKTNTMIYAHPDSSSGVNFYDLRKADKTYILGREQAVTGAGRSRVLQSTFRNDDLYLGELSNFTHYKL